MTEFANGTLRRLALYVNLYLLAMYLAKCTPLTDSGKTKHFEIEPSSDIIGEWFMLGGIWTRSPVYFGRYNSRRLGQFRRTRFPGKRTFIGGAKACLV